MMVAIWSAVSVTDTGSDDLATLSDPPASTTLVPAFGVISMLPSARMRMTAVALDDPGP
jgi:hypothetical protein